MTEQAHHCSSGLTKTFTCVQLSNTYLSATLTTAAFPTAAACRGFDASACTPTPRDLLSSHWQLRLHLIWKVANPLYRCAPRGTRTGTTDSRQITNQRTCPYDSPSIKDIGRSKSCPKTNCHIVLFCDCNYLVDMH